ncbi:MAG: hypothetical protein ABI321_24710 [Polyangia bacterium]
MTLRLCFFALALVACSADGLETPGPSSTHSTPATCDTLSTESDCRARPDCTANVCGICGGTEYVGCTGPGELAKCDAPPAGCPALCPSQDNAESCDALGCTAAYSGNLTFVKCLNDGGSCTPPANVECFWGVSCPEGYAALYEGACAEVCIAVGECS